MNRSVLALCCVVTAGASLRAATYNVDFNRTNWFNTLNYTGTGVLADSGTYWNGIAVDAYAGYSGTASLKDSTGADSPVTCIVPSPTAGSWNKIAYAGNWGGATPDLSVAGALMYDWAQTNRYPIALTIGGLPANTAFQLAVYSDAGVGTQTWFSLTTLRVNGVLVDNTLMDRTPGNAYAFVPGANYSILSGTTSGAGTVNLYTFGIKQDNVNSYDATATPGLINGLQISVPEPATLGLLLVGSTLALRRQRR